MNTQYKKISQTKIANQRVLVRVDFNIPLTKDGQPKDITRLKAHIPTIKHLLKNHNQVILLTHLGRPKGTPNPKLSTQNLVPTLELLLNQPVVFQNNFSKPPPSTPITLLENIRFDPREKENSPELAQELAVLADLFINDAFSSSHREHASLSAITQYLPSLMGLALEHEISNLQSFHQYTYQEPLTLVLGGAKVKTKLPFLINFANKATHMLLGGVTANTILAANNNELGLSKVDSDLINKAQTISKDPQLQKIISIPTDFITANPNTPTKTSVVNLPIGFNQGIYDLGPKTISHYNSILKESKTIIFNGPLGWIEHPQFAKATNSILKTIAKQTAAGSTTIIGGGDSISLLEANNLQTSNFSHVSLGGGALLAYLSSPNLPALKPLIKT